MASSNSFIKKNFEIEDPDKIKETKERKLLEKLKKKYDEIDRKKLEKWLKEHPGENPYPEMMGS